VLHNVPKQFTLLPQPEQHLILLLVLFEVQ
jgi:hypothetical protein